MREASAEREKALLPAVRVLLSTHALCKKKIAYYSRQSLPRSLNKRWRNGNRAKNLNVRYVLKNPDTAKTQTQVLKLNKKKPSSPTLKVKG